MRLPRAPLGAAGSRIEQADAEAVSWAPKRPPIWWLSSVGPTSLALNPAVGGTVTRQVAPSTVANTWKVHGSFGAAR